MDGGAYILVVEDNDDIRLMVTTLLEFSGYRVLEAVDGQDGLDVALGYPVDLIVLDYAMPRVNGQEFCTAYRRLGGRAPVILVTGALGDQVGSAAEACGAVAYLAKPFNVDELLALVERYAAPSLSDEDLTSSARS